ncbi:MAG: hypothetical protein LBP75_02765 [Planctomycetota bacterium]|nr:hypothetical protein [Planctomycetota bacterium]
MQLRFVEGGAAFGFGTTTQSAAEHAATGATGAATKQTANSTAENAVSK